MDELPAACKVALPARWALWMWARVLALGVAMGTEAAVGAVAVLVAAAAVVTAATTTTKRLCYYCSRSSRVTSSCCRTRGTLAA